MEGISGARQLVGKKYFLKRPKITLNIGQSFTLSVSCDKLNKEEIARLTHEIMMHIAGLLPQDYSGGYAGCTHYLLFATLVALRRILPCLAFSLALVKRLVLCLAELLILRILQLTVFVIADSGGQTKLSKA